MTIYSGVGDESRWTFPAALEEQAKRNGDRAFVTMVTGESLTYRELRDDAAKVAALLAAQGAGAGDRIAIMMPNGLDFLRAWAGIGRLSATAVILNTELTGAFLAHPLTDAAPKVLIVDARYLPALDGVPQALAAIGTVLVTGGEGSFDRWRATEPLQAPLPAASDIAGIMYTSGTTGAPKGVLLPHAHCFLFGYGTVDRCGFGPRDHYYVCLPLSHVNGLFMQLGAVLIAGASATLRERFSGAAWLDDIRACGATVTNCLGAIAAFVIAQPPRPEDTDHRLRLVTTAPNIPEHERIWRVRFGIGEVASGFGMTEVNIPLYGSTAEGAPPGTAGRVYDRFFEVEIRDPETDRPIPTGEIGEIMVRPKVAHGFMAGYFNLPEKTVEVWRNLWFHTGDAARMSEDGYVTFVDRIKDCIRRRGENISASDIERVLCEIEGIAEVAAYAVPSDIPGGEDEIMCAVVLGPGANVDPATIAGHARLHVPRFAQPRYIDFVPMLPKTGTEKVQKTELRQAGVTAGTIDLTDV